MDPGADAAGSSDDSLILDVARALVREAIGETRTEVKAIVKERLLSAAMRELAEAAEATASAAPKRGDVSRAVEATVRTIAASPPGTSGPTGEGVYVYGVTTKGATAPAVSGIGDGPVRIEALGDLDALVTPVPLEQFEGPALERRLTDPAWLAQNATAHERVLTTAMEAGSVLPLRFGTIFRDGDHLRRGLAPHASLFADALARVAGRAEWEVKVVCDGAALRTWIEDHSDRIDAVRTPEGGAGAEFMRRKRIDRLVAEEASRVADELGRVVFDAIEAHAEVAVGSGASETLPDGRVVVRSDAYLVARDRWTEVWRAAQEVESLLADRGVEVRVAGPLPPYHFVAVDLREAAGA